jgi:hypothetical protein
MDFEILPNQMEVMFPIPWKIITNRLNDVTKECKDSSFFIRNSDVNCFIVIKRMIK